MYNISCPISKVRDRSCRSLEQEKESLLEVRDAFYTEPWFAWLETEAHRFQAKHTMQVKTLDNGNEPKDVIEHKNMTYFV